MEKHKHNIYSLSNTYAVFIIFHPRFDSQLVKFAFWLCHCENPYRQERELS